MNKQTATGVLLGHQAHNRDWTYVQGRKYKQGMIVSWVDSVRTYHVGMILYRYRTWTKNGYSNLATAILCEDGKVRSTQKTLSLW